MNNSFYSAVSDAHLTPEAVALKDGINAGQQSLKSQITIKALAWSRYGNLSEEAKLAVIDFAQSLIKDIEDGQSEVL